MGVFPQVQGWDEDHLDFAKQAQRKFDKEIRAIRSDNGSEFKNYTLE